MTVHSRPAIHSQSQSTIFRAAPLAPTGAGVWDRGFGGMSMRWIFLSSLVAVLCGPIAYSKATASTYAIDASVGAYIVPIDNNLSFYETQNWSVSPGDVVDFG